jgi:hypothetical protein
LLFLLNGEATNTNSIVFGLTLPGLEPMLYRTRGKHGDHYTTDASFITFFKLIFTTEDKICHSFVLLKTPF